MTAATKEISELAKIATFHLLRQQPMEITHPADWQRDGFPLPIKRNQPGHDGTTKQEYRPMAVLEYVQEVLSGENAAKLARDRKANKEQELTA